MYTSLPRTESRISHRVSPLENLASTRLDGGTPSIEAMESTKAGWEVPERRTMLRTILDGWILCQSLVLGG
jgi:hypothetical protein